MRVLSYSLLPALISWCFAAGPTLLRPSECQDWDGAADFQLLQVDHRLSFSSESVGDGLTRLATSRVQGHDHRDTAASCANNCLCDAEKITPDVLQSLEELLPRIAHEDYGKHDGRHTSLDGPSDPSSYDLETTADIHRHGHRFEDKQYADMFSKVLNEMRSTGKVRNIAQVGFLRASSVPVWEPLFRNTTIFSFCLDEAHLTDNDEYFKVWDFSCNMVSSRIFSEGIEGMDTTKGKLVLNDTLAEKQVSIVIVDVCVTDQCAQAVFAAFLPYLAAKFVYVFEHWVASETAESIFKVHVPDLTVERSVSNGTSELTIVRSS